MQRYLAQTPQDDAGTYARLVRVREYPFEDRGYASIIIHCILAQEKIAQLEKPLIEEANASLDCPQLTTCCPFIASSKLSWAYHIHFGHLKLEFHPHHIKSSETLYANEKWQHQKSISCSAPGCSMTFFGVDALYQWLDHISVHMEQLATPRDPQATSKAAKGSVKPLQLPNDSDTRITHEYEPNGQLILQESLCELLQRSSLEDDPTSTDQPESRRTFSPTSPTAISDYAQTAEGNLIVNSGMNNHYSNQNYLESQLLPRRLARDVAYSFNNHPQMEQQEQEHHSNISDYSSISSFSSFEEIFSLKNSSNNDTNSVSILIRGDDEEAVLYNAEAEQVSRSDLVNEFARFTMSWFIAWTANRRNNMDSNSHDQEIQAYERQKSGRCECGNRRKRTRENGHGGRNKKQQKRDDSDEEDDHDDNKRNIPSIAKSIPNKDPKDLACPFFQRDQSSFGHGRWKLCAHGSWKNYHRVREHVYRKHILPEYHCDRCFEDLRDAQTLLQHQSPLQCEQTALLYATADRISQLKMPMKRGIEECEKWENMYRILFPRDTHIPSPFKEQPFYITEEMRVLAAEIERICNSSFSDPRAQMEQIRGIAEQTIRNNATSTDIGAPGYVGTPNVPSTHESIMEYRGLSGLVMGDLLAEDLIPALGGQDNPASHTLESPNNMDTYFLGNYFQVGDAPYAEQLFFARDTSDDQDISQTGGTPNGTDEPSLWR
ncbi:hypothetical protein M441DRAFT_22664 [Trichoderma asperellum CBS 433.97]|uniref:C2H2-type domain-containing protein n=1 Tax=Trichoderma asperellum (strain ATCC 204424 / CBS 433.97 / NBRC 101777) TaxID=1042311 RepID=A0A2T3ZPC9_TRIA4|nr:hypothetical protein M441DRAFT_22664 [Trichoderma asperellum CBS 433.97]PTB46671.1 hypothetical protein M441DRAFT_22664 [Trichoderma asperellum CBS 433.97]